MFWKSTLPLQKGSEIYVKFISIDCSAFFSIELKDEYGKENLFIKSDFLSYLNTTSFIHSILNMQEIFGEVPCYPKKPFSNKIRCSMLFKINFLSIFYSIEQEKIKMF